MNIRDTPAYKSIGIKDEDLKATGRTTRLIDEYVQELFNAKIGEWICPLDHFFDYRATEWLISRLATRMKNEHGIEIEVKKHEKTWRIRIPIADAERLAKFRADQHEFYVTEMKKLYPDWKEI